MAASQRRMIDSLCTTVVNSSRKSGLSELIASNADDYIKKAILLATNIGFYKNIKDKMQRCQQSCDVFNPDKFIKYLEIGYEKMHENWGNDAQEKVIDIL